MTIIISSPSTIPCAVSEHCLRFVFQETYQCMSSYWTCEIKCHWGNYKLKLFFQRLRSEQCAFYFNVTLFSVPTCKLKVILFVSSELLSLALD